MEPNDTLSGVPPQAPPQTPAEASAAPVRTRPRGRTALLITAAALLGISGGTAIGYGIQAERPPSKLPALSQTELVYPAKALPPDEVPAPLPASQDRQVKTDGDLRKLLIDRPAGWSDDEDALLVDDGWMSVGDLARGYKDEGHMFEYLQEFGIRRVAGAAWKKGEYREATVTLAQFRPGAEAAAADYANGQRSYMVSDEYAGNDGEPLKGSGGGRYYLYDVDRKPGYLPSYQARALVHRGDIMIEINIYDTRPISKKDIRTLAERQLERV
ncbi:hypothetical protein [Streptomyces sp. JH34]|uniref:hypothetical protein n=1 Tax=Streptomyces sp. JH34 TaxID=2793633 RepID=UPI0023F66867|nr:hypothetical protein [Streptomyces sp. JH34]MDF6019735.1 hypothetical protein [Streptomyces sp. JH34]